MNMTKEEIKIVSWGISNSSYQDNLEVTRQLMELFETIDFLKKYKLNTPKDYINMYDWNFYTYHTWEALVESEAEQNNGLTEEECHEQFNKTIWKLPCGWYIQYV